MQININKLGHRWKGEYNSSTTYDENDVVYKEGIVYIVDAVGNLSVMAKGQQDVLTKGHLLTGSTSVGGVKQQVLHSKGNSGIEFRYGDERNTYAVKSLGEKMLSMRNISYPYNYFSPRLLMTDGTVRTWGQSHNDGRHGFGNAGNNTAHYTTKRVAFPKDVVIDKLFPHTTHPAAIDVNGYSWGWGAYAGNGSTSVQIPVRHADTLPELENEKIKHIEICYAYYGTGPVFLLTESGKLYAYGYNGYGQVGDGTTTNVNTIKRIGESEFTHPITKILCTMAATYGWTAVQDSQGQVWTTGNHSNYGLSPTGTIFQKQTKFVGSAYSGIVDISAEIGDYHGAGSSYYGSCFVQMSDGKVYNITNSGLNQVSWGGTNNYSNFLFAENVKEHMAVNGGYGRAMYIGNSNDPNGENSLYFRGYNGGHSQNSNPSGANTTTWVPVLDENLQQIKAVKFNMNGSHYSSHFSALKEDGRLYMWGFNNQGSSGMGQPNTNTPANTGLQPAIISEPIVDYQVNGYSSSATGYWYVLALGQSGKAYVCGYNNYGSANNPNGNYYTFQPIRY